MLDRDQLDYEFKKIYGRYPSVSERLQFKANRPRRIVITYQDIEKLREAKTVPTWMELRDSEKRRDGLLPPKEDPIDTDDDE